MFGFVSVVKYNHLVKLRNEIFLEKEEIAHKCQVELKKKDAEIQRLSEEVLEYKKLFADELQKRLYFAKNIKIMEENDGKSIHSTTQKDDEKPKV